LGDAEHRDVFSAVRGRDERRRGSVDEGGGAESDRVEVRAGGVRDVPERPVVPPRERAERFFNVVRWTEMPRGGHVAAMEEPDLLAEDIRAFFRSSRS
jgi:pimeloyl-ACP methyl ester carboxylesterase